ncbi:MAG TPA: alanine--tRNA ligase, partial [Magnetospirillaceae bacterium]|nr:alanine--tRNA ligase [Magnetospirillaceae bacterium]
RALIEASADQSNTDPDGPFKISHRVVADHLRSSCFLIADGVLPSNEGRGYVLRRIMRRAMRHAQLMGCAEPLMWRLVPALVSQMGQAFPELIRAQTLITETLKLEETRFKQTLDRGLKLLDDETGRLGNNGTLAGDVAFKLYDTYGFPLDLTQDALRGKGMSVDLDGFNSAMAEQKAAARKAWAGSGEAATETVWFETKEKVGASEFLGYDTEAAEGQIVALLVNGKAVQSAKAGDKVMLIANQTPFYGESGGQMGDAGVISTAKGQMLVTDCQKKLGDLIVHIGEVEGGELTVGDFAALTVDGVRRTNLRAHHSATHLLHEALRRALGTHVSQKGSLVAPDKLRFDISHPKALTPEEIRTVEDDVNAHVRANLPVDTTLMTPDDAIAAGAMALFGEKYGEEVRVVSMGDSGANYSVELCGGTHVRRTGDIGLFKLTGESAVAAGVRRIEAMVGASAEAHVNEQERQLALAAGSLKATPAELPGRIEALLEERRRFEKELSELRRQMATGGGAATANKEIKGITFAGRQLDGVPAKDLKGMADDLKKQIGSGVIALVSNADGKASLVVAVTEDLTAKYSAVDLVRVGSEAVGGKGGGGRADMAQAGGPDGSSAGAALAAIEASI